MKNKKSKIELELYERAIQMEKSLAISTEVEASFKFVELGLMTLRTQKNIVSNNHVVLQLLSSGFERIIKILLLLKTKHLTGSYPKLFSGKSFFNKYKGGHGIDSMLDELLTYAEATPEMCANGSILTELDYLKLDTRFNEFLHILTEFSIIQRYFYIDAIVMEKENSNINPFERFKGFVYGFLDGVDQENMTYEEADAKAIHDAIICIERGLRSISRFFTHGFGSLGRQYYADFSNFILLKDENLGKLKYTEARVRPEDKFVPMFRFSFRYLRKLSLAKKSVLRSSSYAEWPFTVENITVLYTGSHFYFAEIGGEIFALTGATSTAFQIPTYFKSRHLKPRKFALYLLDEAKKLNREAV